MPTPCGQAWFPLFRLLQRGAFPLPDPHDASWPPIHYSTCCLCLLLRGHGRDSSFRCSPAPLLFSVPDCPFPVFGMCELLGRAEDGRLGGLLWPPTFCKRVPRAVAVCGRWGGQPPTRAPDAACYSQSWLGSRGAHEPPACFCLVSLREVEDAWRDGAPGGEGVPPVSRRSSPAPLPFDVDLRWASRPHEALGGGSCA